MLTAQEKNSKTIKAHESYMDGSVIARGRDTSSDKLRREPGNLNRGRAATLNPSSRFDKHSRHVFDDGWQTLDELPPFKTSVQVEKPKTVIAKNDSPDIHFDRSINPYRGCEHGCIYCFARPSHSYMGLSSGLDFETTLFAKPDAARLLRQELSKKNYKPRMLAIGTNTDPYQPIEKQWRITREILEVLEETNHPVGIVTKSALVTRDIDILSRMASKGLAKVAISITSLDRRLARAMEPRAATPGLRLKAVRELSAAGIPTSVMVAPVIPALNDHEMERILDSAKAAGAQEAGFILLRLPREVSPLFRDWLLQHYPDRYRHVMNLLRAMRGGKDYDAEFGKRLRGDGPYVWQIGRRFEIACRKYELNETKHRLDLTQFVRPVVDQPQLSLF
ncbi:MAG: PA0069 family radical SAM protein [Pseudomonadota bacterium]